MTKHETQPAPFACLSSFVIRNSAFSIHVALVALVVLKLLDVGVRFVHRLAALFLDDLAQRSIDIFRHASRVAANKELRAFGVDTIFDTSQKSMPNEWYAALPGPSYPIPEYPHIPLAPAHIAQLERAPVKQIILKIPDRVPAVAPAWRARGGRGFYELGRRLDYMNYEVADAFRDLFSVLRAAIRRLHIRLTTSGARPSDKASEPERPSTS